MLDLACDSNLGFASVKISIRDMGDLSRTDGAGPRARVDGAACRASPAISEEAYLQLLPPLKEARGVAGTAGLSHSSGGARRRGGVDDLRHVLVPRPLVPPWVPVQVPSGGLVPPLGKDTRLHGPALPSTLPHYKLIASVQSPLCRGPGPCAWCSVSHM